MKGLLAALLAVVLSIGWVEVRFMTEGPPTWVLEKSISQSVKVRVVSSGTVASGVILGTNSVLLAAHTTDRLGQRSMYLQYSDGTTATIEEVLLTGAAGTDRDFAIVRVSQIPKGVEPPSIRCTRVRVGERVYHVGNPARMDLTTTYGAVATYRSVHLPTFKGTVGLDIAGGPGSSGGPVFDTRGRLVGTMVGGHSYNGSGGIALMIETRHPDLGLCPVN